MLIPSGPDHFFLLWDRVGAHAFLFSIMTARLSPVLPGVEGLSQSGTPVMGVGCGKPWRGYGMVTPLQSCVQLCNCCENVAAALVTSLFSFEKRVQCEGHHSSRNASRKKVLDALLWLWYCFRENCMPMW